ncbi:hypothetical protein [Streptomyces sp. NPDC018693]|uniref:hypothetical protein n=1 Tax=unclassified Streptomyces TaxID=2593676 RepID=UPI00379F477C
MPRPAALALSTCLLATAAAVVSFSQGAWAGIVWVLLAGLTSNMAWYYIRRTRTARSTCASPSAGPCGGCVKQVCR